MNGAFGISPSAQAGSPGLYFTWEHMSQRNGSRLPHDNPHSSCMASGEIVLTTQMFLSLTLSKAFENPEKARSN